MVRKPFTIALIILAMFACLSALASVSRADCPQGGLKKDRFIVRLVRAPRAVVVHALIRRQERKAHRGFGWNPRFRPQRRRG